MRFIEDWAQCNIPAQLRTKKLKSWKELSVMEEKVCDLENGLSSQEMLTSESSRRIKALKQDFIFWTINSRLTISG